jgi:hypothetical protein
VAQLGEGAFAPFGSKTVLAVGETSVCSRWPAFPPPPAEPSGPEPDVPVLVLSGREDLRTPLEDAQATAAAYPRATLVAVPGVGHSVLVNEGARCARRAMASFLAQRSVAGCDREPATASRPAAEHVLPVRLVRGQAREAVAATLSGVVRDISLGAGAAPWVPGLRGGTFGLRHDRLELDRVEWVRGLRLTGTLGRRHRIRVSARVHGLLTGRGSRLAGTPAGRHVVVRLG